MELGWKLEYSAADDLTPISGTLRFKPKDLTKNISIHTIPDNILEGREIFKLTITHVTGDAEVSPSADHCFVCFLINFKNLFYKSFLFNLEKLFFI